MHYLGIDTEDRNHTVKWTANIHSEGCKKYFNIDVDIVRTYKDDKTYMRRF